MYGKENKRMQIEEKTYSDCQEIFNVKEKIMVRVISSILEIFTFFNVMLNAYLYVYIYYLQSPRTNSKIGTVKTSNCLK